MNKTENLSDLSLSSSSQSDLSIAGEQQHLIRKRADEIKDLVRRTAQNIIDIGNKLQEVKQILGHGEFGAWLNKEFNWSLSTAAKMMQASKQFKNVNFTDLNLSLSAIYLLAAPSTPDSARVEALSRASNGESISFTLAKKLVQNHKTAEVSQIQPQATTSSESVLPSENLNNGIQTSQYAPKLDGESSLRQVLGSPSHDLKFSAVEILQELFFTSSTRKSTSVPELKLFQEAFIREWTLLLTENQDLSIILCFVDRLLDKNNDESLSLREEMSKRQVYQVINQSLSDSTYPFTYFKEGIFVLLLPSTSTEEAAIAVQDIRDRVNSQSIEINGAFSGSSALRLKLSFFIQGFSSTSSLIFSDSL